MIGMPDISSMHFANLEYLLGLAIIPILVVWYVYSFKKSKPSLTFSVTPILESFPKSFKQRAYHILFVLKMLALASFIMALARPQTSSSKQDIEMQGIDIIVCLDVSTSMLAADFKPNRLEVSKDVAMEFIDGRPNDRIGLVVFSGEAFTQCPSTTDHGVLKSLFLSVRTGLIEDGTAIGDGLATAVNRLKNSEAISKVIILLTDGANNRGRIAPDDVASIAADRGIRIYTIGIGSLGQVPYPVQTPFGTQYQYVEVPIDETLLKNIASLSGGEYFRATSKKKLESIYAEIDKMEKTKIDVSVYHRVHDEYLAFVLLGILLLILEVLLRYFYFKSTP